MSDTPIRITFGDHVIAAVLWDNPAATSFLAQLPLTLAFRDYARQEVLADVPKKLTMDGMPEGCDPDIADIGYNAAGVVVFHYSNIGYFPGTAQLGHMEADMSIFKGWTTPKEITIERVD